LTQRIKLKDVINNAPTDSNFGLQLQKISTIEDTILNFLYSQVHADSIRLSWLGSEDRDSLVLGNGRPFIVRIINPLNNIFKKEYEIQNKLFLKFQEIKYNDIQFYHKYKIKIKTYVKVIEGKLENGDLENVIPKLKGETTFKIKKKIVKRNIYSSNFKLIDNKNFELDLVLDNGIPIKQLIGGQESINPCLSNLINKKCECVYFDIYDINLNCNLIM
jgi:tRNA pseudouridine synthase 10